MWMHTVAQFCVFLLFMVLITAAYYTFLLCFGAFLYDNKTKVSLAMSK